MTRNPVRDRLQSILVGEDESARDKIGFAGDASPMRPECEGLAIHVAAVITYPGSSVTDLLIGGERVQVSNLALRRAFVA